MLLIKNIHAQVNVIHRNCHKNKNTHIKVQKLITETGRLFVSLQDLIPDAVVIPFNLIG